MSFCPTKDIHSVYLDNELPDEHKKEYDLHIQNCPKCQKELETLRGLHSLLKADAETLTPDSHFVDQSFERLQIKMAYSKNTAKNNAPKKSGYIYSLTGVAAAAVFALIIPLSFNNTNDTAANSNMAVAPVSSVIPSTVAKAVTTTANNVSFDSGRSVLVSGNIQETVLSSETRRKPSAPFTREVRDVEVFRPELGDETISIKVTVPGFGDIPVTTEINVPVGVIAGRY